MKTFLNLRSALALSLALTLSLEASAQTSKPKTPVKTPAKTPAAKPVTPAPAVAAGPAWTIESKRAQAEADLRASKEALEKLAGQTGQEWLCKSKQWKMREAYAQWFLDHSAELTATDAALQAMKLEIRGKLAQLKTEGITPVAAEGQATATTVQVALPDVIAYLNLLNSRVKTCSPDLVEAVIREHNDARTNAITVQGQSVHLSHAQVIDLLARMTTNLNVSLKESPHSYHVELQRSSCGFDLVLRARLQLGSSGTQDLTLSLLDPEAKPQFAVPSRVAKELVSGLGRYIEMHNTMIREAACLLPNWAALDPAQLAYESEPYVTFEQADAEFTRRTAPGAVNPATEQAELQRKLGIELRLTERCRNQHDVKNGIRAGVLYVDDLAISGGDCMRAPYVVQYEGKIGIFALNPSYIYFTDFASVPGSTAKAWSWKAPGSINAAHLLAARLVDGVPTVLYLTYKGDLGTINSKGVAVPVARFSVAPTMRSRPPKLELVHSTACDEQSKDSSLDLLQIKVEGRELGSYSCAIDAKAVSYYDTSVIFYVNSGRYLYARYANSGATTVSSSFSFSRIQSAELQDGVPVVTAVTHNGEIKRFRLNGTEVK